MLLEGKEDQPTMRYKDITPEAMSTQVVRGDSRQTSGIQSSETHPRLHKNHFP